MQASLLLGCLLLVSSPIYADQPPAHEEHGTHEHGTGHLSLAQNAKEIEITLDTPGMNLFGFEYLPKTPADKQTVAEAEAKLWLGSQLFTFDADAECKQVAAKLNNAANQATNGETHSDVEMAWTFHCEKPDALQTVSTKLFTTFTGFHQLHVEWLTDKGSSSVELSQDGAVTLTP